MLLGCAALLAACAPAGSRISPAPAAPSVAIPTAQAPNPATVAVVPMSRATGPAMSSGRRTENAASLAGFTQIPGGATFAAASADGTLWVLSTLGIASGDKFIYHYANGTWTAISGAASRIAVGPDGNPWVVTQAGGIYHYDGTSFNAVAGGASDITVAQDGTVYVISSQGGNAYGRGIYHYVNGAWTQMPGAAVRIAASPDTGTHGSIAPGSVFVVNAQGGLYSYSAGSGFVQLPGGATELAPAINGGLFVLGVPASASGEPLYYGNLDNGTWTQQGIAGISVATDGTRVYVVAANGNIYASTATYTFPVVASPSSLAFTMTGAGAAQTFTVSESGYAGSFTASAGSCAGIASVAPTAGQTNSFTVTAQAAGSCGLTVTDSANGTTTVPVSVTTTTIGGA